MKRKAKDWDLLEAYFDHGVDIENRRVWLVGDIDEDKVLNAIKGLYLLDTLDRDTPCELFISSYGGDITESLAVYDIIQTLKCPVWTFAFGKCQSAAPLLLAAGEPGCRWVAANVALMTHQYSTDVSGKGADIKAEIAETERLDSIHLELMAKHSKKPLPFWRGLIRKPVDFYFTAEQAIEWGLADAIWTER